MIASIKSPFTGGQVEILEAPAKTLFRKEEYSYTEYTYRCVDTGRTFTTDELDDLSLHQVYDQYCKKHGIPNAEEVKQIREKYGLSALAMSSILGLGENQYRLYEDGAIPSESTGKLIKLVSCKQNMISLLIGAKAMFSTKEFAKYYELIAKSKSPLSFPVEAPLYASDTCQEQTTGRIIKIPFAEKVNYRKYCYSYADGQ